MRDINISPLLSIFDTSPDGFFIVRDCVIEYANRVINEMAGENIEGKEVLKVFDKKLVDKVRITLDRTNSCNMDDIEVFGKPCTVQIAGTANGFFVTVTLISEANRTVRFPATPKEMIEACEEMRSPLTTIFSALNLISKKLPEDTPEKVLDYLAIINQNCYKLLKRTDCMADFARCLENRTENFRNCDIASILRDFVERLKTRLESLEIGLVFECAEERLVVNCDITRIKRAVLNILTSLIRYKKAKNTIKIKLSGSGHSIILRFYPGEKSLSQDEIVEVFKRQLSRRSGALQCSDSLLLIKTIIESHGGNIFIENSRAEGSVITVMLPKSDKPNISSEPAPYISDFMLGMSELCEVLPFKEYAITAGQKET
ncbi:MAG: HAMP domain-containing histidine kinase [Clostridiales bacterium]|jgi:signal transduction histidine kinase|nr:HAMP domain-containing histidine kinase [Clostridiales bacterium]